MYWSLFTYFLRGFYIFSSSQLKKICKTQNENVIKAKNSPLDRYVIDQPDQVVKKWKRPSWHKACKVQKKEFQGSIFFQQKRILFSENNRKVFIGENWAYWYRKDSLPILCGAVHILVRGEFQVIFLTALNDTVGEFRILFN